MKEGGLGRKEAGILVDLGIVNGVWEVVRLCYMRRKALCRHWLVERLGCL